MKRSVYVFILAAFSYFAIAAYSQANVDIEDASANNLFSGLITFNSIDIETGAGLFGDYELISCVADDMNNNNSFFDPSPGSWTVLDNDSCGGQSGCISGIWGRFTNTTTSTAVTCSWSQSQFVAVAGSFRFSNVDPVDPIIDVQCLSGESGNPVPYPSIVTEAGSQVVYVLSHSLFEFPGGTPQMFTSLVPLPGLFDALWFADAFNTFTFVATQGETLFFEEGGPTPSREVTIENAPTRWRTCTIGLRMTPEIVITRSVPALNEWGLIGFAAVAGIAGLFFLRRRSAQA